MFKAILLNCIKQAKRQRWDPLNGWLLLFNTYKR